MRVLQECLTTPNSLTVPCASPCSSSSYAPPICARARAPRQFRRAFTQLRAGASAPQPEEEDEGLLLPEEDWTVAGGYQDSLSKNTQLGRAVDEACKELDSLGELERDSLVKANELLRKLGYKGDITAPQIPPKVNKEARD